VDVTAADDLEVRQARHDDREAVVGFTEDIWPELGGDYVPEVFDEWVEADGPERHTLVAAMDDRPVGIVQAVLLGGSHEAWAQGMRVDPGFRGESVSHRLSHAAFEWAAARGATVCRSMVFSWNAAGLGQARAVGFDPVTEFRWLEPAPDPAATQEFDLSRDPAVAWSAFRDSDASRHLHGLGLDLNESWALAEVTQPRLGEAESTLALLDGDRRRAMTYRTRTFERENDDGVEETWAEYGVAAWDDHDALSGLAAAVARDAARAGAERTRVLIPETPRHVSDAAYARVPLDDDPDFVLERDLTGYGAR
jgi:GNAT superfamily N-acetyltransferase